MIEKHKPDIMILDLHYFGFRCVGGTLGETKFATYVWNKYGIPNVYISPACEAVWKELKLHESRPLAIIERPFRDEVLINVINSAFGDAERRVHAGARIRGLLTREDRKRIRASVKRARKPVSGGPLGRGK